MVVTRELVTKLTFDVDQKAVDRFSTSIIGFKTKFAIAAAAAAGFATQIVKAVSGVSDLILETQDLSRTTGIAFQDLYNLSKAASNFRIQPADFNKFISTLSTSIQQAKDGVGSLYDFIRNRPDINIFNNDGSLKNTLQVLGSIIDSINTVDDLQKRIELFSQIGGGISGARLEEFFRGGSGVLSSILQESNDLGDQLSKQVQFAKDFERNLAQIFDKFNDLIQRLVIQFGPFILEIIAATNQLLDIYTKIFSSLGSAVKTTKEAIGSGPLTPPSGLNLSDQQRADYASLMFSDFGAPSFSAPINVTNNFDINVPQGTPQEQRTAIQDGVSSQVAGYFRNFVRDLFNNNPKVE